MGIINKINSQINLDEHWEVIETVIAKYGGCIVSNPSHHHDLFIELDGGDYAGYWHFQNRCNVFEAMADSAFIDAIASFSQNDYIISINDK